MRQERSLHVPKHQEHLTKGNGVWGYFMWKTIDRENHFFFFVSIAKVLLAPFCLGPLAFHLLENTTRCSLLTFAPGGSIYSQDGPANQRVGSLVIRPLVPRKGVVDMNVHLVHFMENAVNNCVFMQSFESWPCPFVLCCTGIGIGILPMQPPSTCPPAALLLGAVLDLPRRDRDNQVDVSD